jgi:hypothetical protein
MGKSPRGQLGVSKTDRCVSVPADEQRDFLPT